MFLLGDAAGNEDAEMTDAFVNRVDDRLPIGPDFIDVGVEIENPVQRLLRRRDIVALGAEYQDRRSDIAQIDRLTVGHLDPAGGEIVADEELQVIPTTGQSIADVLGVTPFEPSDLFRPRLSLRFGANYLASQLATFEGNAYHALAAYNGGPGTSSNAIDAAGEDIDLFVEDLEFDETKAYVKLVMEHYARYRQLYEDGVDRPTIP